MLHTSWVDAQVRRFILKYIEIPEFNDSESISYFGYADDTVKFNDFLKYLSRKHNLGDYYQEPRIEISLPTLFKVIICDFARSMNMEPLSFEAHIKPIYELKNKLNNIIDLFNCHQDLK